MIWIHVGKNEKQPVQHINIKMAQEVVVEVHAEYEGELKWYSVLRDDKIPL